MILVDSNQIMITQIIISMKAYGIVELEENLIRKLVISSLRQFENKFSSQYGEMILCYDSKHYWRKDYFPYYKSTRKKERENSKLDWNCIFECLNKIRDEIKENLHYKVMEVYGAEADDIIATLTKKYSQTENIIILSMDKDFGQLHKYNLVKQYNPIQNKEISQDDPYMFLKEHIVKGDRSDGIPNFLSPNDTFFLNKRQKPISKKNIEQWRIKSPEEFCDKEQINYYNRNKILIDFDYIPSEIQEKIFNLYDTIKEEKKPIKLEYFIKNNLVSLLSEFS